MYFCCCQVSIAENPSAETPSAEQLPEGAGALAPAVTTATEATPTSPASEEEDYLDDALTVSKEAGDVFGMLDTGNVGELQSDQIREACLLLGYKLSAYEVARMIADFDTDGNGTIDLAEFTTMYTKIKNGQYRVAHSQDMLKAFIAREAKEQQMKWEEAVRRAFGHQDREHTGNIPPSGIRLGLNELRWVPTDEQMTELIFRMDALKKEDAYVRLAQGTFKKLHKRGEWHPGWGWDGEIDPNSWTPPPPGYADLHLFKKVVRWVEGGDPKVKEGHATKTRHYDDWKRQQEKGKAKLDDENDMSWVGDKKILADALRTLRGSRSHHPQVSAKHHHQLRKQVRTPEMLARREIAREEEKTLQLLFQEWQDLKALHRVQQSSSDALMALRHTKAERMKEDQLRTQRNRRIFQRKRDEIAEWNERKKERVTEVYESCLTPLKAPGYLPPHPTPSPAATWRTSGADSVASATPAKRAPPLGIKTRLRECQELAEEVFALPYVSCRCMLDIKLLLLGSQVRWRQGLGVHSSEKSQFEHMKVCRTQYLRCKVW